jgi:5-methylcytosine-specific restriction endonuclease McrA
MKPAALMKLWGNTCAYCGVQVWLRTPKFGKALASADHYWPRCSGGLTSRHNMVLTCAQCNIAKSGRDPRDWLPEEIRERVESKLSELKNNPYREPMGEK